MADYEINVGSDLPESLFAPPVHWSVNYCPTSSQNGCPYEIRADEVKHTDRAHKHACENNIKTHSKSHAL